MSEGRLSPMSPPKLVVQARVIVTDAEREATIEELARKRKLSGLPPLIPRTDTKKLTSVSVEPSRYSPDFFFPSAEVATAYRNVKNKGAASPTTSRFAESVNNIEIAQNELVDALVNAFVLHMSAKQAWTIGDTEELLKTRLDLDDSKKTLRDVFNNVNKFLTLKTDPNLVFIEIHKALHAPEIPNEHQPSVSNGGKDVYTIIYNIVKRKIDSDNLLVSEHNNKKRKYQHQYKGGKKHKTHRAKRTHRKKHRTHRKKRTHRKTRKN
jgi:hypothetical protein